MSGRAAGLVGVLAVVATPARAASEGGLGSLVYPWLNLIVLIAVLFYAARKPIRAFFAERRNQIRDDLKNAAELRAEAERRYASWQRRLADLDRELERVRGTARERAETEREKILAEAAAAAERIRADARAAVDQELRRAREKLREEASELAVELAAERLRERITDADRRRLLDEFIERIERGPATASGTES